jgi:hypothetical protein
VLEGFSVSIQDISLHYTQEMEEVGSSETLVPIYQTALHHIPEDRNLNIRRSENMCNILVYACKRELAMP